MKRLASILVIAAISLLPMTSGMTRAETPKGGLFVNLTTDDTWTATKAIMFVHKKILARGHRPVAIWLNVRAIRLADKNRESQIEESDKEEAASIQAMLSAFIEDGGIVIACAACAKAIGLTQDDLLPGIEMGNPDLITGLLFDPSIKTLSW